jgi:protein TonB
LSAQARAEETTMAYAYAEQAWSSRPMAGLFVAIAVNVGMLLAINNGLQFDVEDIFKPDDMQVVELPTAVEPPPDPVPVPVPEIMEPAPPVLDAPTPEIDFPVPPIEMGPTPFDDAPPQPPVVRPAPGATQLQIDPRRPLTPPVYPTISRRLGEEGSVLLLIYVMPDGRVGDVKIKRSSGHPRLDEAAVAAARKGWRFKPATQGGAAVAAWAQYAVAFKLEGQQ